MMQINQSLLLNNCTQSYSSLLNSLPLTYLVVVGLPFKFISFARQWLNSSYLYYFVYFVVCCSFPSKYQNKVGKTTETQYRIWWATTKWKPVQTKKINNIIYTIYNILCILYIIYIDEIIQIKIREGKGTPARTNLKILSCFSPLFAFIYFI